MKKLLLIAVFFLCSTPATVFACRCLYAEPAREFGRAELVFIGRMIGGTEKFRLWNNALEAGQVRFAVEEVFKGQAAAVFTVNVASLLNTSCAYGMQRGQRYLVYAIRSEYGLYTGGCTRTILMTHEGVDEDLKFLRNLPPPGVGGELTGVISANLSDSSTNPLSDVSVRITDANGQVFTAFTDKNGEYRVERLKPGKYRVEPELPASYVLEEKSVEVQVGDRATSYASFDPFIDGRVSGRLIDAEGNALNDLSIRMSYKERALFGHSTGKDGVFEIRNAPPGDYVLVVELVGNDFLNNRKSYYYPGSFEREEATVVRVGFGEKVEGIEFRMPAGYSLRTIEGEVVWPDGTPARNADVMLLCPQSTDQEGYRLNSDPSSTKTDEHGRFRLEGLSGDTYWLFAKGRGEGKKQGEQVEAHSTSQKISVTDNLKNLKIKLSRLGNFSGFCGEH